MGALTACFCEEGKAYSAAIAVEIPNLSFSGISECSNRVRRAHCGSKVAGHVSIRRAGQLGFDLLSLAHWDSASTWSLRPLLDHGQRGEAISAQVGLVLLSLWPHQQWCGVRARLTTYSALTSLAVLYVIILSAALDLVPPSTPKGVIAFWNILPSLVAKFGWPYVLKGRIRYARRLVGCACLSALGMLVSISLEQSG
jgi:hypothetical protein